MKSLKKIILTFLLFYISMFMVNAVADTPAPPTGGHGTGGNQLPGGQGAPLDGGLGMLMAIGAAYGIFKLYSGHKAEKTQDQTAEKLV